MEEKYEVVIGLEVHCQLRTESKIFSAAPTAFGAEPNTQVAHVDLGLPGALPVLNKHAVELAMSAGVALGCEINQWSQFARKNYFYPDLPKGYQISQHMHPICGEGKLAYELEDGATGEVRIERIHMEEDAGKSSHLAGQPYSAVDLNRAGVPLIEIVSRPDMRSADEAVAYLKALHQIVVAIGVCDGNMEEGSFRCDANVSIRPVGQEELGTRCELKNINSFRFVRDAINYEVRRQIGLVEAGQKVTQQTRLYDPDRGETFAMRDKEESHDYRYFPDPDLPPLVIEDAWLERVKESLPELPAAKRARYQSEYELSAYDAGVLVADFAVAEYFEQALASNPEVDAKSVANWVINEVLREVNGDVTLETIKVRPEGLAAMVKLIDDDVISGKIAKKVFKEMLESGKDPDTIIEEKGLKQITDPDAIAKLVDEVIAANPEQAEEYRGGKQSLIGFFVGQVMRASRGKANPQMVNQVLREKLS
jgi:aspartyl-tRNA(Asn)/glutamyl-tRNA(Gln) amidotransferase subunit B